MNTVNRLSLVFVLALVPAASVVRAETSPGIPPKAETTPAKQVVVLPRPLEPIAPKYPAGQLDAGIDGYAVLEFDVTLKGKVENIRVVRSAGEDFEKAAIKAVKRTRFSVGTVDGVPTHMRASLKVRFAIDQK